VTYDEVKAIFDTHKGCSTSHSSRPQTIYFDRLGTSTVKHDGKRIHVPDSERWAAYPFRDLARYVRKAGREDRWNIYYELIPEDAVVPTCREIKRAVARYDQENAAGDSGLRLALDAIQSLPASFGRFLAEVCLIADWGTFPIKDSPHERGITFLDRVTLAKRIGALWSGLNPMRNLDSKDWDAQTEMLGGAVEKLSKTDLLLPMRVGQGRQLSLASKYLHWCVNSGFPIWDGNAHEALKFNYRDGDWKAYRNWLTCAREEGARHKACCLRAVGSPGDNLMRTLDKALFIIGEEMLREGKNKYTAQPPGNSAK
jgi:hypothetical protein